MRILFALLIATAANAAESPAIYQRDPQSVVNRLYLAVATRTLDGIRYGVDIAEPYFGPIDDSAQAAAVLDEFLKSSPRELGLSALQKALLQNDLWAAFDSEARNAKSSLRPRLARAIWKLRLSASRDRRSTRQLRAGGEHREASDSLFSRAPRNRIPAAGSQGSEGPLGSARRSGSRSGGAISCPDAFRALELPGVHQLPGRARRDSRVSGKAESLS